MLFPQIHFLLDVLEYPLWCPLHMLEVYIEEVLISKG